MNLFLFFILEKKVSLKELLFSTPGFIGFASLAF
jgi:hypothetical protein